MRPRSPLSCERFSIRCAGFGAYNDPAGQREFAAINVRRYIENNLPVSDQEASFPHSLQNDLAQVKAGHTGETVTHEDGSAGFYLVEVQAQRVTVPYRSPLEHKKPEMHLETAIVVGPQGEEVYTDELNRVKVMFIWDRQNAGDAGASCWVRVAQSDTGGGYGGVHVPRVGEEVLIGYMGGDCDRPIVLYRVYNGSVQPQWHSNGILSGYRSKEYSGSGYNEMVLDDATGQNRARLFSSTGSSLLHLGYLIDQSGNTRGAYLGSGFDLKTDSYGAVRASQGLYVATHSNQANGQQLDVREAQQQLVSAESVIEAMSEASPTHQAESLANGHDALKRFTDATQNSVQGSQSGGRTAGGGTGSANGFKEPVMLFAGSSGIALSTQQSVHVASERQTNLVSGQSTFIASGKSLVASVAEKISLFAQNAGMKLFAAKGKVEVQAHSDNIEVTAQKTVKILSATENVEAVAKQELLLTAGGAYIRVKNGNIEIHAPGKIDIKGASHVFSGPTSLSEPPPQMPSGEGPCNEQFRIHDRHTGEGAPYVRYRIETAEGKIFEGMTDEQGLTSRIMTASPQSLKVFLDS